MWPSFEIIDLLVTVDRIQSRADIVHSCPQMSMNWKCGVRLLYDPRNHTNQVTRNNTNQLFPYVELRVGCQKDFLRNVTVFFKTLPVFFRIVVGVCSFLRCAFSDALVWFGTDERTAARGRGAVADSCDIEGLTAAVDRWAVTVAETI